MPNLQDELVARVRQAVPESLRYYGAGENSRFAVEAGIAIELSAKAILAAIHPALIVDPRSFESLLRVCRLGPGGPVPTGIRTIGCIDALERVSGLIPEIRVKQLRPLADARNGGVHLLGADATSASELMVPYVEAMKVFGEALHVPFNDLFGDFAPLAQSIIDKAIEEAAVRAQAKITRAKALFEELYGSMDEKVREAITKAIEASYAPMSYEELLVKCPACGCQAKVSGGREFREWMYDSDEDGTKSRYPVVDLVVERFRCGVCKLLMTDADELDAAQVPTSIELMDVGPFDYGQDDWDPDW